jgi:hypothetical protein
MRHSSKLYPILMSTKRRQCVNILRHVQEDGKSETRPHRAEEGKAFFVIESGGAEKDRYKA